jgi:hypothetical protein
MHMSEVDLFKRSYLQGRMVFIQGPKGTRKVRMAYEMLGHCHVQEHEIVTISATEFGREFSDRVSDFLIQGTRVFLVTDIHRVSLSRHPDFLCALKLARRLFFTCGIRVVLISSRECALNRKITECLATMRIRVRGCHSDNADERVHWALDLACRVTQKRVTQLTAPAADFLESAIADFQDEGLLHTLIFAVRSSTHGVIRLEDFIFPESAKSPKDDDSATRCN